MFSKHNERQSSDDRMNQEANRSAGISPLPSTGVRDAIAMPISTEPTMSRESRSDSESVVGPDDRFEGTLRVQRGLRILGQFTGEIEAATSVTIEEGARVEADLTADEAIIAGEYTGKLVCRQRVEIRATGLVKGEIETVRLMLHEGGFIDGALHMQKPAGSSFSGSSRISDSQRSGVSPRSTTESLATATTEPEASSTASLTEGSESSSTNGTEPTAETAAEREPATISTRGSSGGRSSR